MNLQSVLALGAAIVWVAAFGLLAWRLKRRRKHYGAAAAGSIYEMLNEDKRKAIEIIIEEKTGERDPERATGEPGED